MGDLFGELKDIVETEALLGSLAFGIPLFVEGGTQEVGEFVASHPAFLVGTHVFAPALVVSILYVADVQDVRVHRLLFGVVPRRLVGGMAVPFLTAPLMMTAWGRVRWAARGSISVRSASLSYRWQSGRRSATFSRGRSSSHDSTRQSRPVAVGRCV